MGLCYVSDPHLGIVCTLRERRVESTEQESSELDVFLVVSPHLSDAKHKMWGLLHMYL